METFSQFIEDDLLDQLHEGKNNFFNYGMFDLGREFADRDIDEIMKGLMFSFQPIHRKGHDKPSGPVLLDVKKSKNGSFRGRIRTSVNNPKKTRTASGTLKKKKLPDENFYLRGGNQDQSVSLDDLFLMPFATRQSSGGGGMF